MNYYRYDRRHCSEEPPAVRPSGFDCNRIYELNFIIKQETNQPETEDVPLTVELR